MQSLEWDKQQQLCGSEAINAGASEGQIAPDRKTQVLIVGAGLAGLAAAQRLHEAGVRDVVVLDAQARVGGRVHTVNHSDYLLELGAQWLHGAEECPLYNWLIEKDMLDDFEDASLSLSGLFCTDKGNEIDQKLVHHVLKIMVESKMSLSKNRCIDLIGGSEGIKNAGAVFRHQLELMMQKDDELARNKKLVYAIFEWFLRYETIENCCDSMDDVAVTSYTDWTDWGDGSLLNFKHGYRSLLDWFCDNMPAKRWIHLNKQVLNIEMLTENPSTSCWLSDESKQQFTRPILVKYADTGNQQPSSDRNKSYSIGMIECEHVIVTVSLGFLKKNHETLFKPPLPEAKQELIKSIGFGTVNKIILQFDSPFWSNDQGIKLVWLEEDIKLFPSWVRDIIAFDVVRRQPNLLIGWIGGHGAKQMESETDHEVGQICLGILHKFLPANYNKPSRLISCRCSRWHSNPFTCGSYSFQSMRSLEQKVEKLHEPLYNSFSLQPSSMSNLFRSRTNSIGANNRLTLSSASRVPRVLFAGEATAGKLYSTTHGAIITGWREADRLKDHLLGGKANIQQASDNSALLHQAVIL